MFIFHGGGRYFWNSGEGNGAIKKKEGEGWKERRERGKNMEHPVRTIAFPFSFSLSLFLSLSFLFNIHISCAFFQLPSHTVYKLPRVSVYQNKLRFPHGIFVFMEKKKKLSPSLYNVSLSLSPPKRKWMERKSNSVTRYRTRISDDSWFFNLAFWYSISVWLFPREIKKRRGRKL